MDQLLHCYTRKYSLHKLSRLIFRQTSAFSTTHCCIWNTTKIPMTKTRWHWITETKQEDLKYYQNGRRLVVCLFVFFFPTSKGLLVNSPIPYNFLYYNLWEISLKIGSLALPLYIHTHTMYFLSTLIIFLWKFT